MIKQSYIIVAPEFAPNSAGVTVLHKLAFLLNSAGYPAYIYNNYSPPPWSSPTISTENGKKLIEEGAIIVYPEVVSGNPLQGRVVARYILNSPGLLGGEKEYDPAEICFCYVNSLLQPGMENDRILYIPVIDTSVFFNNHQPKTIDYLVYFGKHKKVGGYPESKIIYRHKPSRPELGKLLRKCKKLICYDNFTALSTEATLCGCPVVIIPDGTRQKGALEEGGFGLNGIAWGNSPEEFIHAENTLDKATERLSSMEAKVQQNLQNFIAITQAAAQEICDKPKTNSLSIIIPNYNGSELLKTNLPTLIESLSSKMDYEIIIVDNGSTDGSQQFIQTTYPLVQLISFDKPIGFARACNAGAKSAKKDLLFFLNNDVKINRDFSYSILQHFMDKQVFAVTPKVLRPTQGNITESLILGNFAGGIINAIFTPYQKLDLPSKPLMTFSVCGAAFIACREKFWLLNGFDEMLSPYYYEETDLSYRAQKFGWKIIYDPSTSVFHLHNQTIGKQRNNSQALWSYRKNQFLCVWKNIHDQRMLFKHVFIMLIPKLLVPNIIDWKAFISAMQQLPQVMKERSRQRLLRRITNNDIQAGQRKTINYLTDREVFNLAAGQAKYIELLPKVKNILVIRPDAIGDMVLTLPAIQTLKKHFPKASITVLAKNYTAPLLLSHPAVDHVIQNFELAKCKFDLSINFYNEFKDTWATFKARIPYRLGDSSRILTGWMNNLRVFRNWDDISKHEVMQNLALLAPLGIQDKDDKPHLTIDAEAGKRIRAKLLSAGYIVEEKLLGIHVGGKNSNNKPWNTAGYIEVINWFAQKEKCKVVLLGGGESTSMAEEICHLCQYKPINLTGQTTLEELIALIGQSTLYFGNDGGPTHIAAALNIPLVALFLAKRAKPLRYGPWKTRHIIIKNFSQCDRVCNPPTCSETICSNEISAKQVISALEEILAGKGFEDAKTIQNHWLQKSLSITLINNSKQPFALEEANQLFKHFSQQGFQVQLVSGYSPKRLIAHFIKNDTNIIYHAGTKGTINTFMAWMLTGFFQSNKAKWFRNKNKLVAYCSYIL
ncbi:MAG: glycosyltransferase family 9 protein [Candidatus Margulisiibacteriota bacterium]